ncbi:PREDICTED: acyl-CoA Delta(11) desaturase-like [Vollenhovia emeryi]|uniref:acyl-CoA Delta(11) desaturase-like n=1 Tax=Vollenhovia emeryi TaxID=411798 RepID=UPI0005F51E87|nr:PREDICTED: acyl-CoA Delta(11) desaturase-like [Vollenhovia emeryi]
MTSNLTSSSTMSLLEASQQDVSQKKLVEERTLTQTLLTQTTLNSQPKYEWKIIWKNVIALAYLHIVALYTWYLVLTMEIQIRTFIYYYAVGYLSGIGITAGVHRLWCHRSYKAKWPMRVILMVLQTIAFQKHIYDWVREHRVHHKFTDTDADPHNSKRGFFFSHVGWLMVRKHPDVISKGATIDMSDLEKDPIVVFQRRYYAVLMPLLCFVLPMLVPIYFWNEKPIYAWYGAVCKYVTVLNGTWLVNSAAHMWGTKPYDTSISATDYSFFGFSAFGEMSHNYHHVFPWDYKAAELGFNSRNITCGFIDFFAWLGWAYDLKTARHDLVKKRAARTGDGSIYERTGDYNDELHTQEKMTWGWNDADMSFEDKQAAEILNKEPRN